MAPRPVEALQRLCEVTLPDGTPAVACRRWFQCQDCDAWHVALVFLVKGRRYKEYSDFIPKPPAEATY